MNTSKFNTIHWKHENGGVLKVQEGTNELYPAGIAIPSNETIDFFKDFAQRYKKFNHIDKSQLIQDLISKDKAIVLKRGLPTYNTENKQIFIPSDDVGVSTYSHELVHKLNDLVLERTNKERKLLNDAYPLSIAKHVYGRAPEDMRNELIEDERFSTNTELRRKISSDYGNILGKKLNKVIKSLSTNDIINYVNNINGYVGESDFLKYPEHIIDGKTLFEHWKEDIGDVPEYYNMPWEELPKSKQDQWQYLYDSREGVAPNYMIFDEDKPKVIKKALIKVAQESKSNNIRSKNFINVSRQGGILKAQYGIGRLLRKINWGKVRNSVELIPNSTKADISEYINTVDDALPERQPLTISKSKQFWNGTSESKLTDAEKAGIPKGERNQPIKVKTHNEKQITPLLSAKYIQRFEAPPLDPDYPEISNLQRAKYRRLMDNKFENIFDNTEGFNKTLQSYIDGLPNEIDPRFTSITDGEIIQPSIAVRGYRNYLLNNGVDAADISDDDLARLLTQEYKNLSNTATGKLKNILLWHGSPTQFDSFDFSKTSANTGNSGALGPGNYFSTHGGKYGHARNKFDYSLEMNNFQPYIVSNITSTPAGHDMVEKGLLPKFIDSYAMRSANNQAILQKWISEIPTNDNRAYIDFTEAVNGYFDGPGAGIMIRRNTGIKSLYPHPSRFIRNTDGTITLIPADWNDARVNFKKGGVLKAQEGTGNGFWSKLWNAVKEGGMAARDAKLGAIGAQQVRDLYSEGKNQEAQDLAKQYAKANTTGIALAGGAASTGLLGDLMVTGATTAADTFIDGDTDNFSKNLVKNAAGDLIGHGVFGALKKINFGDILAKIKHPTWKKYYHGSPEEFDIKNFYKGTVADSGLHMSDRKEVAEYFAGANWFNAQKPTVYEFYAPKPTMEFMDLHGNGVNMLSGNTKRISGNALGKGTFDGTPYSQLEYKALRENGGEDVIDFLTPYTNDRYGSIVQPFQLKRDVTIPIEKYHWPNRPKHVDDRLKEMRRQYDLAIENGDDAARVKLNSEVSDIMAENGIPVVKYANNNAFEGGGMSYMLFDRSKLHLINPDHQFDIVRPTVTTIGTGLGVGYGVSQVKDE